MRIEKARRIEERLRQFIDERATYGIQLAIGLKKKCLGVFAVGLGDWRARRPVTNSSLFDLASLTKIISTVTLLMVARQQNRITSLDEKISRWLPSLASGLKDRSLRDLLVHRGGLPPVFQETRSDLLSRADRIRFFLESLDRLYTEDHRVLYSDVGYMTLGTILESIYGMRLKEIFSEHWIRSNRLRYGPIHSRWGFLSPWLPITHAVPCQSLEDSEEWCVGWPQDPRAQWLSGDTGHAGLFGNALAVEEWGREIFMSYYGKALRLSDRCVREFINFDLPFDRFIGGFDTPTGNEQLASQAGRLASTKTIGHLGYSGSSFWMDIESGQRVSLLCHRHGAGIDPLQLNKLRPDFHDWIRKEVFSNLDEDEFA